MVSFFSFQETSFASSQPVTRSLSSVSKKSAPLFAASSSASPASKIPLPRASADNKSANNKNFDRSIAARNSVNLKKRAETSGGQSAKESKSSSGKKALDSISPWLVSDTIASKKEKEKSKIPQLKTVITTEL